MFFNFLRVPLIFACLAFLTPQSAVAQLDGDACGDGSSAVVFLHDQFQDSASFAGVWTPVCNAPDIRAVRYDRRGYGQSPASTEPYSNITDLATVLQNLNISEATLVASGTGAGIALEFALLNPTAVNGLVLSGPSLAGSPLKQDPSPLASITVPALVLIGANDTPENITEAQAIGGALTNASTVIMLSAAKYITIERPSAFAEYVIGFVSSLEP